MMKIFLALLLLPSALIAVSAHSDDEPIMLESSFIGDKEQPTVSYFIPWQGLGAPDKLHWNMEGKHDESLSPVDRDVMLRSMRIYDEMSLESPVEPAK
ncbi:hypothetical protein EDC56_1625 [Sinobacterium caligoides]|uniref:Uncharacterized protein n=1 Tax=Sinobacterium caligoides TaxID=933926 RepID=A0A3N2DN10_9GAMM|nr:hypothetical protein [Sinobacterium caligoides]ROS01197.1 hypothetical protein EDC56_1625 [Sinobacterium caligoides]